MFKESFAAFMYIQFRPFFLVYIKVHQLLLSVDFAFHVYLYYTQTGKHGAFWKSITFLIITFRSSRQQLNCLNLKTSLQGLVYMTVQRVRETRIYKKFSQG